MLIFYYRGRNVETVWPVWCISKCLIEDDDILEVVLISLSWGFSEVFFCGLPAICCDWSEEADSSPRSARILSFFFYLTDD